MIKILKNIISYLYPVKVEHCAGNVSSHLEVNMINGKYVLDTAKVNYSYGSLHKIFEQTFNKFNVNAREVKNVLILGFGAGSVASLLTEKYGIECQITGIEKDQIVIHLACKYFNIKRFKNLELICGDAYDYVQTHSKKFNVIVVDIYIDEQVPKCFHEKRFLKQLDRLLQQEGILFFNKAVINSEQKTEFNELATNIEELFGHSLTYKLNKNGTVNYMLVHDRRTTAVNHAFVMKHDNFFLHNKQFIPSFNYEIKI
jgi:predicted methyltransferase